MSELDDLANAARSSGPRSGSSRRGTRPRKPNNRLARLAIVGIAVVLVVVAAFILQKDVRKAVARSNAVEVLDDPTSLITGDPAARVVEGIAVGDSRSKIADDQISENVLEDDVRRMRHKGGRCEFAVVKDRVEWIDIYDFGQRLGISKEEDIEKIFGEAESARRRGAFVTYVFPARRLRVFWEPSSAGSKGSATVTLY